MDNKKMSISIIIPNYNGKDIILQTLESIYMQVGVNYEIIVIDDNSNDNSIEILNTQSRERKIRIFVNADNKGYSGSCDVGAKHANYPIIMFMNSDAFLIEKTHLFQLCNLFIKDPKLGVVGFYQKNKDLSPQFVGSNIDLFMSLDPDSSDAIKIGSKIKQISNDRIDNIFMTGGACYAIRKDVYFQVGGLDSSYFLYVEELDLMWRIQLFGYKLITYLATPIIHLGGTSTNNKYDNTTNFKKIYLRERNSLMTMIKNYHWITLISIMPIYLLMQLLQIIYLVLILKPRIVLAYAYAINDVLNNLKSLIKKRSIIQENRKISDISLINNKIIINNYKIKHILKKGIPIIK